MATSGTASVQSVEDEVQAPLELVTEVTLAIWLLVKGFAPRAYGEKPATDVRDSFSAHPALAD